MTEKRIRFRDIKLYDIVDSLDDLRGPAHGVITPEDVRLKPIGRTTVDIDDDGDCLEMYREALTDCSADVIAQYVNKERLLELFPDLCLDDRVFDLWRGKFPEIAARGVSRDRAYPVIDPATGKETRTW
ncbi:transcriptional regulator [Brachybacterium epidermidis]|uniref:transcriptional regulator n=1 Tax=Brachybacterium epidermidis TaxID=2781983 RepID=UPI00398EE4BC